MSEMTNKSPEELVAQATSQVGAPGMGATAEIMRRVGIQIEGLHQPIELLTAAMVKASEDAAGAAERAHSQGRLLVGLTVALTVFTVALVALTVVLAFRT